MVRWAEEEEAGWTWLWLHLGCESSVASLMGECEVNRDRDGGGGCKRLDQRLSVELVLRVEVTSTWGRCKEVMPVSKCLLLAVVPLALGSTALIFHCGSGDVFYALWLPAQW